MPISKLRGAGHTPSLVAALLHFDVSFMVWVLLGALGATIGKDLGLSPLQKGLMVAVPPLSGSMFRLILGPLVDRLGARRTGLASLGLTLVPLAWGWLAAGTFVEVLGLGLLLGIAGSSFVIALPLASRWYPPEKQGLAMGIAGTGNSGTLIAALAAPRVAAHVGWHATFGLAAIPVVLVWVLFAVMAKEPPPVAAPADGPAPGARGLLAEADARWLCGLYMVTFGGFVGLASYLPLFFVDRFDLSLVTAGSLTALCASAGSFLRPLGGLLADRLGGARVLGTILALIAGMSGLLGLLPGLAATVVLLWAVLGGFGVGNGAVFQLVGRRFPSRVGAMTGLVGAAGGFGGFLLPFGFGALRGSTGTFALGFLVVAAVTASAALVVTRRTSIAMPHPVLPPRAVPA
jgi:NNP family nitrate/nitrite transporter-like MFS transporter